MLTLLTSFTLLTLLTLLTLFILLKLLYPAKTLACVPLCNIVERLERYWTGLMQFVAKSVSG